LTEFHNPKYHPFPSDPKEAEQKLHGNERETNYIKVMRSPSIC